MNDWKKVYFTSQIHQANIVKDILEQYDCSPILLNKKDSSYNNFGNYEIFVPPSKETLSIEVINEHISFQ